MELPTHSIVYMDRLYEESAHVFMKGSFADVLNFNLWKGQFAKLLWVFNNARYLQLIGLFILGMLTGRSGIYKSKETMITYSRKILPYGIIFFIVFYSIVIALPYIGVEGFALHVGTTLFKTYANLGQMIIYISCFMLLYYYTKAQNVMDKMAPVGRMSVTNYMAQGFIGVPLFYGFGANFAAELTLFQCMLVGFIIYAIQIIYSNQWMKRFYYGPVEWLWRIATWFKLIPIKREKATLIPRSNW